MSTEEKRQDDNQSAEQLAESTEVGAVIKQDSDVSPQSQSDSSAENATDDGQVRTAADDTAVPVSSGGSDAGADKPEQLKSDRQTSGRSGWLIPLLAMLVLFSAGGVMLWLEQQQLGQQLQQSVQQSTALQSRLDARLDEGRVQQQQALNANTELQRSIQAMRDLIDAQQQAPRQDEDSLILHEALMLVRMAQAQLQVRHNTADALLALQWAQQRVQTRADSSVVAPVLAQLQLDIQQLRNLPARNNLVLAQQLASLTDAVDRLPLRAAAVKTLEPEAAPEPVPDTPDEQGWRAAAQAIWQEMKQLVVIRHRDQPLQPVMNAERKQILHDVLRLRLEALQVQLMHDAGAAQNVARARALSWLREWFDEGNADVINVRDWLNSLPQPQTVRPDLEGSVSTLSNAIRQIASQAETTP